MADDTRKEVSALCGGGCYSCCYNEDANITILPSYKIAPFDQHGALQDLRSIKGITSDSRLKFDFTFDDILRWTRDDQMRLESLDQGSWCHLRPRGFRRVPLLDRLESGDHHAATIEQPVAASTVFPKFRCCQNCLAAVYSLCFVLHLIFLIFMDTGGVWKQIIYRVRPDDVSSLQVNFLRGTKTSPAYEEISSPPPIDWTSFDYDIQRFDIFFTIACVPMPFIFMMIMLCCKGMMRRLICVMLAGISERIRRTVNLAIRQSLDLNFHEFQRRLDYFFYLKSDPQKSKFQKIHHNLHQAIDELNESDLRYDATSAGSTKRCTIKRILKDQLAMEWNSICTCFYIFPMILSFVVNFGMAFALLRKTIFYGWRTDFIDPNYLLHHPKSFFHNSGVYWILASATFNFLTLCWIFVVIADDFGHFILEGTGLFQHASEKAISHANFLVRCNLDRHQLFLDQIERVWDEVVLRGFLPLLEAHRAPDFQWGDLHEQLSRILKQFDFVSSDDSRPDNINNTLPKYQYGQNVEFHKHELHNQVPSKTQEDNNSSNKNEVPNQKEPKIFPEKQGFFSKISEDSMKKPQWDPFASKETNDSRNDQLIKSHSIQIDESELLEMQKKIALEAAETAVKLVHQQTI